MKNQLPTAWFRLGGTVYLNPAGTQRLLLGDYDRQSVIRMNQLLVC